MLTTLLETRSHLPRRRAAMLASAVVHSVVLIHLVMQRGLSSPSIEETSVVERPVFIDPSSIPVRRRESPPAGPAIRENMPRFPVPPIAIDPPSLPDFPGHGLPGPIVSPPPQGIPGPRGAGEPGRSTGAPMTVLTVDQPVEVLPGQRPPRYPPSLERAGIGGEVAVQFVVDTTGRVEPASAVVLTATHPEFARAVRERLRDMRYVPARAGGRVVRQLVEQQFHFEVVRR